MDIGEHIRTSVYRFFLRGTLEDDASTRAVALRYLESAVVVVRVAERLFDQLEPDCIVSHHGMYLLGGVVCEVARRRGIRIAAWDTFYQKNSVIFSHGGSYVHELRSESTGSWEFEQLSDERRARVLSYLHSRRWGNQDYVSYSPHPSEDVNAVREAIGVDPAKTLVAMFSNVAWDARVCVEDTLFAGPIEWALETVAALGGRDDVQLVVRVHPAEVNNPSWVSQQRLDDEIRRAFPTLPANVVIVEPASSISSYQLAEMARAILVYSSNMGLEALAMGRPTVIAGDAFYSRKGLGVEPATREEYFDIIAHLESLPEPTLEQTERVLKYCYHYFFRRVIALPDFRYYAEATVPPIHDLGGLRPGAYSGLDTICEGIMSGTPFLLHQ